MYVECVLGEIDEWIFYHNFTYCACEHLPDATYGHFGCCFDKPLWALCSTAQLDRCSADTALRFLATLSNNIEVFDSLLVLGIHGKC